MTVPNAYNQVIKDDRGSTSFREVDSDMGRDDHIGYTDIEGLPRFWSRETDQNTYSNPPATLISLQLRRIDETNEGSKTSWV